MGISDYHVHTNLSNCADHDSTPEFYLSMCASENVTTLGFSNHMWDEKIPGASGWYQNQTVEHVLSIRDMIPKDTKGVRVVIGCEIDMDRHFTVGMAKETRVLFDYVLLSTTHLHMKGFSIDPEVKELSEVRLLMLRRLEEGLKAEVATAIAHPFIPLGFKEQASELLQGFSDAEIQSACTAIRESGLSMEINSGVLSVTEKEKDGEGFAAQYRRLFTLARECGCEFHIGSDAHREDLFRNHKKLVTFAAACGIHSFCDLEEKHRLLYGKV